MKTSGKKIGIMGGTFDPIHMAHLILAEQACCQFGLDFVLFMPSAAPPHKNRAMVSSAEHREQMVLRAIAGNPKFEYSDLELRREGMTYTADTLKELQKIYPDALLYFIMGADSLFAVDTWYMPEEIFKRTIVLAGNRLDVPEEQLISQIRYLDEKFHGNVQLIDMPDIAISSSMIRSEIEKERSIRYYVPESVFTYIYENHLYVKQMITN